MKILMVNKFHYIKGGSETYYFALKSLLERHGHTVVDFSMKDSRNFDSPYSEYFVENVDYAQSGGPAAKLKLAAKILYSREAREKFEALVRQEKPDLVHLHIFQHQLSPSILDVVKKYRIPCVYTAHDLKMICLNYKMMHHGKVCEDCMDGSYLHCAKNRCVKDSLSKSLINVAEGYLHRWRKSYDAIAAVITPSAFYKSKFEAFGIAPERVVHIPNFLNGQAQPTAHVNPENGYYLYFGRLSEEKGLYTLVNAFRELPCRLCIVGTGPLEEALQRLTEQDGCTNIQLLGFMSGQILKDTVAGAKAIILPSEWYENGPYSAIEALQVGRPIIGANIGGIPELVQGNGYLFESGDPQALAHQINKMEQLSPEEYQALEKHSLQLFDSQYTAQAHYERLWQVYQQVLPH